MRDTRVHDRALYDKCVGLGCHGLAPWRLTLAAMKNGHQTLCGCHGLAPWRLTLAAMKNGHQILCGCHGLAPWSAHVSSYEERPPNSLWMPWACPVECSRW